MTRGSSNERTLPDAVFRATRVRVPRNSKIGLSRSTVELVELPRSPSRRLSEPFSTVVRPQMSRAPSCTFFGPKGRDSIAQGAALGLRPACQGQAPTGRNSCVISAESRPVGAQQVSSFRHPGLRPGLSSFAPLGQRAKTKHTGIGRQNSCVKTNSSSPYLSATPGFRESACRGRCRAACVPALRAAASRGRVGAVNATADELGRSHSLFGDRDENEVEVNHRSGRTCCAFFGPKGRDSIAQGAALGSGSNWKLEGPKGQGF